MHAAQIYAEMLGQVCHREAYKDPKMFQEVQALTNGITNVYQAFILHARHATFYLFYAKFPNTYLRDIVAYGSQYLQRVPNPETITIHQSRPFRMRFPQQQAEFLRLLSEVLYYLVSGNSLVFYISTNENNHLYGKVTGLNVLPAPSLSPNKQKRTYTLFSVHN